MTFTNSGQLHDLFLYAGFGFLLCIYNDLFRIRRRASRPKPVRQFVLDVLLCVSAFLLFFLFSLSIDGGRFRFLSIACCGIGFAVCRATISRLLMAAATVLLRAIRRLKKRISCAFSALWRHLFPPLQKIGGYFAAKGRAISKKFAFFQKNACKKEQV